MNRRFKCPLFLFVIFLATSHIVAAQQFKAIADYDIVNVHDTFMVNYIFSGNKDSIKKFIAPDFSSVKIVAGPVQSTSSSMASINGVVTNSQELRLLYFFQPVSNNEIIIEPGIIEMMDGKKYYSEGIKTLVNQETGEKRASKNAPMLNGDNPFLVNSKGDFFDNAEALALQHQIERSQAKIDATNRRYILITGWVYQTSENRKLTTEVLENVNRYLKSAQNVDLLDSLNDVDMPRYYYALDDTTHLRKSLDSIFRIAGMRGKSVIQFAKPKEWGIQREQHTFTDVKLTWALIYGTMNLKKLSFYSINTSVQKKWQIRFAFKELADMDSLCDFARKNGYEIINAKRKPISIGSNREFYFADFIKVTKMNEDALFEAIQVLDREGKRIDPFFDNLYGVGIYKGK